MALILAFTVLLNVLSLAKYDNIFEQFFGKTADSLSGDTLDADTAYYKSDFSSAQELYSYEEKKVAEIAEEGTVLLENDGLLPLERGTTLSLFSHSSVDLVSGGSGSGSGSFELTKNLKDGLTHAGLKVNDTLWKFYESGAGSSYKRGTGVINYGADLDWSINECPLSVIRSAGVESSYGDSVAMFVLSRTGGEGGDEARDMAAFKGKSGQHYLEPDDTELEIIAYLNEKFEDIILLVNCNNAVELGWVKDYPHIRAVVNFPGAGRTGTYGLGNVLVGIDEDGDQFSPSGHLVDTFVYDDFSAPATRNMGDFHFSGTDYYYVNYAEGIYVGYKYYETRYEDAVTGRAKTGNYDYASTVLYPFGYGLSYTDFEWTEFSVSAPEDGKIKVTLTVTNTGTRAGKDVVQVYAQSPFTEYDIQNGIEKASVSLVGFAKTKLLAPDAHEDITVEVSLKDLISYDAKTVKGYLLEAGTYLITAAPDAHTAINNILMKRSASEAIDTDKLIGEGNADMVGSFTQTETNTKDYALGANGTPITNRFDGAALSDAVYLSRTDWEAMDRADFRYGTPTDEKSRNNSQRAEIGGKAFGHELTAERKAALDSTSSLNPDEGKDTAKYTYNKRGDVELIDLRGLPYDDPLWDTLLDEMDADELSKLIDECGYCSPAMPSIAKPKVTDLDGPAGLNEVVAHGSTPIGDNLRAMTWPAQYILACTWDESLAEDMGRGIAEDGLYSKTVGWYGPAVNIHRTPFSGRNFEYYSEDSFLSGKLGYAEVQGAAKKGMYAFLKHLALNDQETHRDHYGLITFADEQTIREIYLKPFEMTILDNTVEIVYNEAVKENGEITGYTARTTTIPAATAVMTSFNRIGLTWAGGNYNLITGVLRGEWGFNGFALTDYETPPYMGTLQSLAAGGDAKLKTVDMSNVLSLKKFDITEYPAYEGYAREAAHHILYTVANSAAMNGYVHGVRFVNGFAFYKLILIAVDIVMAAALAGLAVLLSKKLKKPAPQKTDTDN